MTFARVRALIVVMVLFVTAGVVVIMAIQRDTQTPAAAKASCVAGLVPAKIKMPDRNAVTINVLNGTSRVGLAEQVAGDFKNRGFNIKKTETAPDNQKTDQIAEINYGPEAVGAASLVSAYFLVDEAKMNFDIKRTGAEVDVVLGTRFQQLATTTEVNQSIAALGNPALPPGTCDASA
jgi:LytR cell envelope-related transcriptional attenuator